MDITDIVFLALVYFDVDIDMFGIVVPHAVLQDCSVAIAQLIVFLDELLLVSFPALGGELL